jgi:Asp-tRNA(Asn)/Glu-tRNA(Gln) amidotransferase A subunit family amidase
MSTKAELEFLDNVQDDAELMAEEAEDVMGLDRREFVFLSLMTAAASTFGFGARALAQGTPSQAPQAPPLPPLGNGEPLSWTFQPYPGGTGALMEQLVREHGAAAFQRATFTVPKWTGPVPNDPETIAFLPAHRLSALIRERQLTSGQVTRIYLDRVKRLDPQLLCAVTIMEDQAMAEAAKADAEIKAGKYRGPLHGIPYGVKDLFSTRGVRTTWGSADFENRTIDEDAEVVVRLRDAGAVLMAKLATGLFAQGDQWYRGRTNNPWDLRRGSSGSSAGPSSATAAGCVAFGIGTETSGSIVSPARECGLSALRPTFGRVSRYGGMVLAWSQDRVGPICRTIEDCALVFNAIHGVDPKDPSTVMTPFRFDRDISGAKLASLRIGVDANAPKEFVDKLRELGAKPKPIGPRPQFQGGALGIESAAAFDSYVQAKAKELGIDLATIPEPQPGRGPGAPGAGAAGGPPPNPGNPTGVAAVTRWTNGRFPRAFEFVQQQRRRYILITQMAELLEDFDMYVPGGGSGQGQWDIGLHAQTGHPCAVVPYKFEPQTSRPFTGGRPDTTASPVAYNPQPICAVLAGNLYNDDLILSVANKYQLATDWHTRHPKL